RKLFKDKCASCHQLDRNSTGPAITPILKEVDEAWAIKWIRNWKALVDSGDQQAIEAAKFSPAQMTTFPTLTDDQIKNIIAYAKAGESKKEVVGNPEGAAGSTAFSSWSIAGIALIIVIAISVIIVLGRAVKMLERLILKKQGVEIVEEESVSFAEGTRKLFKNKKFV